MTASQDAHSLPQLGQVIAACMEALNDGDYQVARHLADRAQALARTTGPLGRANAALGCRKGTQNKGS
ncbi:hypothetical protein [Streptomyces sp. NPDC048419]|uniref:hypothetical protein n=1 Tax=Streptomyces sp. NPDC048419 TaxID=3365547 RepID=UPI003718325C